MTAPREPPYRVALLQAAVALDAADRPLRGTCELLLFVTLFQHLVRHPDLAVIDPDDTSLEMVEGELVNLSQLHTDEVAQSLFTRDRRDELLWLDLDLSSADAPVRLRTRTHGDKTETFAAMGSQSLADKIGQCLGAWLAARDLGPPPHPLESFDVPSLLQVCRTLRAQLPEEPVSQDDPNEALALDARTEPSDDTDGPEDEPALEQSEPVIMPPLESPAVLRVPFLRAVGIVSGRSTYEAILQIAPEDPLSLRERFFAGLQRGHDFALLRRMTAAAPGWGKPYLSFHRPASATTTPTADDGFDEDDRLHAYAAASIRIPGNHWSHANYANALVDTGRLPEAVRYRSRAVEASGFDADRIYRLMETEKLLGRRGAHLRSSIARIRELEARHPRAAVDGDASWIRARLVLVEALRNVGRLGEAIALKADLLRGREAYWPRHTKDVEQLRTSPSELAQSYAWEGHFRGDPGRVVEGLSSVSPHATTSFELRALMQAWIALGEPTFASFAWAHIGAQRGTRFPPTRIEAARALLLGGDLERAMNEVLGVALHYPTRGYGDAICRVLRLAATLGPEPWEALVSKHLARGARTVARLLARDAADFVPGAGGVRAVVQALGEPTNVAFDPAWLEPLRACIPVDVAGRIDALFSAPCRSLAEADHLVGAWPSVLHAGPNDPAGMVAERVYVAAQALARYFAAITQSPSPGAGGLRVVATEALQACVLAGEVSRRQARATLEVLERAAVCDEWTLDTWLLQVEQAFSIEDHVHGHLDAFAAGLPRVGAMLRGDERVAAEYRRAHELRRSGAEGWGVQAHPLFARAMRAGAEPSHAWSDAAANGLPVEEAIDVHWTCVAATMSHGLPSVNAARALLELGRGDHAFDALCAGLAFAGKNWRKDRLAELASLWKSAKVDVPLDWKGCNSQGSAALQKGDVDRAIRCLRWCAVLEPDNRELWRNLGIAHARAGHVQDAVEAFSRFDDVTEGVKLAGLVLCQFKHTKQGLDVLEYVSRWFTKAEDHRYHAVFAWQANADEAMARAYDRAFRLDPAALGGVDLDGYACVLAELGDFAASQRVIARLEAVAGDDPELRGCVLHRRACVDIGLERWDDAVAHARQAIELNPAAVRKPIYEKTLSHAERREKAPITRSEPDGVALARRALGEGDFQQVLGLAESADWRLRRAALLASEFRYETENDVTVTPRARGASERILTDSEGATDVDVVLARVEALRIREGALFSLDPPAPLGDRLPQRQFRRELALRLGLAEPPEEVADVPPDVELPPAAPVTKASQYADLLRAMQGKDPRGALETRGLDLAGYERVCTAWAIAIADNPRLGEVIRARISATQS